MSWIVVAASCTTGPRIAFRAMLNRALDLLDKQISDKYAPTALRAAKSLLYLAKIGKTAIPAQEQEKGSPRINADERG